MKNVLIVTHGNLPLPNVKGGAVEKLVQYIIDHNEKRGDFNLTILSCFDKKAELASQNYRKVKFVYLHTISSKWRLHVNRIFYKVFKYPVLKSDYVKRVYTYLKSVEGSYDTIIFENNPQFIRHRMPRTNATRIFHIHNDWFSEKQMRNLFYRKRMVAGAMCFDKFFCVSPFIKSNVDKYVLPPDKNIVIRNGVDRHIDNCKKDEIVKELRNKLGINDSNFVFMYSGRLIREKGVLELLQAFSLTKNEDFKLIVVGGADYSSNASTDYVNRLKEFAANDNRIIFTGYIDPSKMPYYNMISHVVVIPTYGVEEAASLTAIEAVHENNVLIVSDSGHLRWWGNQECATLILRNENFITNLYSAMDHIGRDKKLYHKKSQSTEILSKVHTSMEFYNQLKENLFHE